MTRRHRPRTSDPAPDQRGTMTVELVLLTPLIFALLAFLVGLGRAADARGRLVGAVRDAARAASLAPTPAAAATAARQTALANLAGAGLECRRPQVGTDTTDFTPGGTVRVTVRCALDLSALIVSGLPGRTTLTADATAPLDSYRTISTSTLPTRTLPAIPARTLPANFGPTGPGGAR
jgi:Flp pilus assembly protein TadG